MINRAKELRPKFPNIAFSESLLQRNEKEYDKALEALDRLDAEKLNPQAKVSYYYDRGTTIGFKAERMDSRGSVIDSLIGDEIGVNK